MRPFSLQDPNIISGMAQIQQQPSKFTKRSFNQPISNKSNTQYQLDLKHKNENTVKINKLSELKTKDEPKIYYTLSPIEFNKQRDLQSINANLPLINCKKLSVPIKTRQFLLSTYKETNTEINNTGSKTIINATETDPVSIMINSKQSEYSPLKFKGEVIKISEDGVTLEIQQSEIPSSLKKRPLETSYGLPLLKKKHRYDIPLENSRTISAKEVLRMVDSSLISSDMDLSQNNSTSTSMILNENTTPLKTIPSYLKFFNNNNNGDTPLKNSMSSSTPQQNSKLINLQDDEFRYSPLTGSKLKNI